MVNVGSFLLIAMLLICFIENRRINVISQNLFVLTAIMELLVERGYFILVGPQQIAYRTICELVMAIYCLRWLVYEKVRGSKKLIYAFTACLCVLLIGWILLLVIPTNATGGTELVSWDSILVDGVGRQSIRFNAGMISEIIQTLMFLLIALTLYLKFSVDDWRAVIIKFLKYSKILVYLNAIEIFTKVLLHSSIYTDIVDYLLGKSAASMTKLITRGGSEVLWGLTKESSHYVFALSILIIMYLAELLHYKNAGIRGKKIRNIYVTLGLLIIQMLLSMSFSTVYFGIMLLLLLLAIYIERKGNSALKILVILMCSIVLLAFMIKPLLNVLSNLSTSGANFWQRRFASLLEEFKLLFNGNWLIASTALEWSNRVRLGSTFETFKLLMYRPLFGLGLSATTAHSALAMLVSGAGIIGTALYINFISWTRKIKLCIFNKSLYFSCIFIYLLMNIFNSLGLRPFYECWVIILFFGFQYIAETNEA